MKWLRSMDPRKIPSHLDPEDVLDVIRERILQYILLGMAVFGTAGYIAVLAASFSRQLWWLITLYSVVFLIILATAVYRPLLYHLRAGIILLILFLLGLTELIITGLNGDGTAFLIVFSILASVLLGWRTGLSTAIISIATIAITSILMTSGKIDLPPLANIGNAQDWIMELIVFSALTLLSIFSLNVLTHDLERTVMFQKQKASDFHRQQASLEERINRRTDELQQRASQFEAASRLARDITIATQLDDLLDGAVNLICEQFGFDHAGIFLLDERREFAVLQAATGAAGQAMLRTGHRLKAGEIGIVGYVVNKGEARITPDVMSDPFHFSNPLLPDTRSEMAIPLQNGGNTIGALDIQSNTPNHFTQDDAAILQIIADQLSVAIDKARLVERLQHSLTDIRESNQEQVHQAWKFHLTDTRKTHAYRFKEMQIEANAPERPYSQQAYSSRKMVVDTQIQPGSGATSSVVSIPIQIRQQVIGVLEVHLEFERVPQDMLDLLQATTHRMAMALENARLLEAIKVRAERDHMVSNISASVRSATDIDSILKTAASELGRTFGISEVVVQLRTEKLYT